MIDYLVLATSVVLVAVTTSLVVTVFSYLLKWLFVCHIAIVENNPPVGEPEEEISSRGPCVGVGKVGSQLTSFINFKKICEV